MNLSFKSKPKSRTKKTVLFVCVENAGRSQMAEAFFRKYAPSEYEATSAGTHHTSQINPLVVQIMKDVGIDITNQKPKEMTEDMIRNATKIVNMGCMDKNFCPTLFIPKVSDWGIADPKGKPIEKVKEIRDEIERSIKEIVEQIRIKEKDGVKREIDY
jgi:arsenate reductase (thioredoxin)